MVSDYEKAEYAKYTDQKKLIIASTHAPTWVYTKEISDFVRKRQRMTEEEYADEIFKCYEAGAAVAHIYGAEAWPKQ
jgi:hypothetical protein